MTPNEMECLSCGTVIPAPSRKLEFLRYIRTGTGWAMKAAAVTTAVSLFTPWGPPFVVSACTTAVLSLCKRSADEMLFEDDKK
jgi:hypothetical protein